MFRDIFFSLAFEILCVFVVEIRRGLDPYKSSLCFMIYHSAPFNFVLLAKETWHREDITFATLIGCELELVVLMRNAFDPEM